MKEPKVDRHDPLCPKFGRSKVDLVMAVYPIECCCGLIERVRADEKQRADLAITVWEQEATNARQTERARLWEQIESLLQVSVHSGRATPVLPYWEVREVITGREKWDRDEDN